MIILLQRSETPSFHPLDGVLSDCRKFVEQLGYCGVNHVYREQNCVADSLAQASYIGDLAVCPLDSAPSWIGTLLADDVMGVSKTCWISFDNSLVCLLQGPCPPTQKNKK
ncbi:unnamed protein product [Prunus armeniaca]